MRKSVQKVFAKICTFSCEGYCLVRQLQRMRYKIITV